MEVGVVFREGKKLFFEKRNEKYERILEFYSGFLK